MKMDPRSVTSSGGLFHPPVFPEAPEPELTNPKNGEDESPPVAQAQQELAPLSLSLADTLG